MQLPGYATLLILLGPYESSQQLNSFCLNMLALRNILDDSFVPQQGAIFIANCAHVFRRPNLASVLFIGLQLEVLDHSLVPYQSLKDATAPGINIVLALYIFSIVYQLLG